MPRSGWSPVLSALFIVAAAAGAMTLQSNHPLATPVNWDAEKLGPKPALSVFWAGHSLMEQHAESGWGRISLMTVVGTFAESRKRPYTMTDHTLFGSPLSALWRGSPHSYHRDATAMVAKREDFERNASHYDTLVLTEAVPLTASLKYEFSPYYTRRFYCALKTANPAARVYLYQTWISFQGSHLDAAKTPPDGFDWRQEMKAERPLWDRLADAARTPNVQAPGWLQRLGWTSPSDDGCAVQDPIFMVPVGNAMVAIDERLSAPHPGDHFQWPDGTPFQMTDLVANPLVATRAPRDPKKPLDDIHASAAGIYLAALVHFATLYRDTPMGLPFPPEIGAPLAGTLQCIAWETVVNDPRSGVLGKAEC